MPALAFGLEPVRRMVGTVLDAGQEVQLHLHPNWTGVDLADRRKNRAVPHASIFAGPSRVELLTRATELLVAAGAPQPIAFRAGNYAANDDTLAALAQTGFVYDTSHNGAHATADSLISLPERCISPIVERVIEVPVTVIEERPGRLRTFQLCALSSGEMVAALDHARANDHAAVTIVSHGFELANRAGTRANGVHVRRFESLCDTLHHWSRDLPTVHFADRPSLPLDRDDTPLQPIRYGPDGGSPNSSGRTSCPKSRTSRASPLPRRRRRP